MFYSARETATGLQLMFSSRLLGTDHLPCRATALCVNTTNKKNHRRTRSLTGNGKPSTTTLPTAGLVITLTDTTWHSHFDCITIRYAAERPHPFGLRFIFFSNAVECIEGQQCPRGGADSHQLQISKPIKAAPTHTNFKFLKPSKRPQKTEDCTRSTTSNLPNCPPRLHCRHLSYHDTSNYLGAVLSVSVTSQSPPAHPCHNLGTAARRNHADANKRGRATKQAFDSPAVRLWSGTLGYARASGSSACFPNVVARSQPNVTRRRGRISQQIFE